MKFLMTSTALVAFAMFAPAYAQESTPTDSAEVVVTAKARTYATSTVSTDMIKRVAPVGSVNQVVNELPGVIVTEADNFGSADWATSITLRGFNSGPAGQQIGTTIDGLPNGGSTYGGGSKANRYIDILDLKTVEVSQGTADVSSPSNEALGGTLKFVTTDPKKEQNLRVFAAAGDQSAQKVYARYDTGEIASNTYAFVSGSFARNKDFVDNFTPITRDHFTAKLITKINDFDVTAFLSYDDANEAETDPSSLTFWKSNPTRDYLTSIWTGIPMIDQNYREGWRAHRENIFNYYRAEGNIGALHVNGAAYYHTMEGQGDWIPPYLVNVTNDGTGAESELGNTTVYGAAAIGKIYFVNPDGTLAVANSSCVSSSALGEGDPACYASTAKAVMSYRHTHYHNVRAGLTLDLSLAHNFSFAENTLRGGLWIEDGNSSVIRDWHKVTDAATGPSYNHTPYYVQYRDNYTVFETMYYVEDVMDFGDLAVRAGVRQFFVDRTRVRKIGTYSRTELSSNSDPLLNLGMTYETPVNGLELFAGFSQNFNAVSQGRMGDTTEALENIEPETADNVELGLRFKSQKLSVAATVFDIKFDNRIIYIADGSVTGIDYLSEVDGTYINLGGVKSKGIELLGAYRLDNGLKFAGSYTYNEATYDSGGDKTAANGTQLFGTPKHMFVMSADYANDKYDMGISTKYVGDRYVDSDNVEVADGYYMTNAYIGIRGDQISSSLKGFDVRMTVNNLMNVEYVNGISGGAVYPGAPRTVLFSVSADFQKVNILRKLLIQIL